jgi:hypothetical protein
MSFARRHSQTTLPLLTNRRQDYRTTRRSIFIGASAFRERQMASEPDRGIYWIELLLGIDDTGKPEGDWSFVRYVTPSPIEGSLIGYVAAEDQLDMVRRKIPIFSDRG